LSDETVRAKQKELGARITEWRKKLAVPLEAMAGQEERLALSMEKQRRIHSRCPIVKGRRVVEEESQVRLTSLGREIAQYRRRVKLRRNPKDPEGMKKLEPALERLNELRIQHLDQKRIEFVLG